MPRENNISVYVVYIMLCKDGTLYTGITNDIQRRFSQHTQGKGGHYTRAHIVEKVVYIEECGNRSAAQKREAEIKTLSREAKLCIIENFKQTK